MKAIYPVDNRLFKAERIDVLTFIIQS